MLARPLNASCHTRAGRWLCFLDADDVMHPTRVAEQLEAARVAPMAIVGCGFVRDPPGSTPRYVLDRAQLARMTFQTTQQTFW